MFFIFKYKAILKRQITVLVFCWSGIAWAQNSVRNLSEEKWNFRKISDINWLPATVPGTVHTDLYNNKQIPDPFYGSNEKQLQWIENEDWEYQADFFVSKAEFANQNCILQFDGLDTYAAVYLNNQKILDADNMFRTWKINVKGELKLGKNNLRIVFFSAVKKGREAAKKLTYTLPGDEKIFTRKAQYQYGWDWGPRFVTAGIWKKVQLQFWNSATIENVKFVQKELTDDMAQLEFHLEIQSGITGKFQIKWNEKTQNIDLEKGGNSVVLPYLIKSPKRWWSNGLGEATLYDFDFRLFQNKKQLSQTKLSVGLRTIELIQDEDALGKSFYFRLNGVPVFMKGANYIPPDSFLPRSTDNNYKTIVQNAVCANMNMLRVWGGGVYADDAFYNECDKNGILVWQDFMFACAMYPGDEGFLDNVKNEVMDNVIRLRNHPSIALWCGNNESDEGWHNWGWQKQYNYSATEEATIWNDYQKLFHEMIPQTLNTLLESNENRYWPSSPSIGWGRKESLLEGDSHYWGVWWGMEPFEVYQKKVGRFMSEYGFQGMPALGTFKSVINEADLNLNSESVKSHQKHPTGYQTIQAYLERDYKTPTTFEGYIYVSQLLQTEGMKTAIEAHRRAKTNCMGTLYWQLNDCWPVTSWSSVDYYGNWKALHYQVKRSFENLLLSVVEENDAYKLYVVNDDLKTYDGKLLMELFDFNGRKLWEGRRTMHVESNSSNVYVNMSKKEWELYASNNTVLSMHFESENKNAQALYYFAKPKDLQLTQPTILVTKIDDQTIEVTSDVLAKNVYLSSDGVFFSDNFFDLLPNEKRRISIEGEGNADIKVNTLFDSN